MRKYLFYLIFVIGLILLICGDFLVGFNGMFFGFSTTSNKSYNLIGVVLFGVGAVLTVSATFKLFKNNRN